MGNWTSAETIINSVIEDTGLSSVIDVQTYYRWIWEAVRKIGLTALEHKEAEFRVENHQFKLPDGFYAIEEFRYGSYTFICEPNSFYLFEKNPSNTLPLATNTNKGTFKGRPAIRYRLTPGWFHCDSINNVDIGMAYRAIPLDKRGIPMVESTSEMAVKDYCIMMNTKRQTISGKVSPAVFKMMQDQWYISCTQARPSPTPDEIKYVNAVFNSLLPTKYIR